MEQLERIIYMEKLLDEATEAVSALKKALERYNSMQKKLQELDAYYTSREWRQDFDDDSSGKLPANLKRGVLSEDAVYDLLEQNAQLLRTLRSVALHAKAAETQ